MTQTIFIASDHAGLKLKERVKEILQENNLTKEHMTLIVDVSSKNTPTDDYPDFAKQVAKKVIQNKNSQGLLICGTGIGMSISANKFKGIRAALCRNSHYAKMARAHNDANVLVLAGSEEYSKVKYSDDELREIILTFQETKFEGGRHLRRVKKIEK